MIRKAQLSYKYGSYHIEFVFKVNLGLILLSLKPKKLINIGETLQDLSTSSY